MNIKSKRFRFVGSIRRCLPLLAGLGGTLIPAGPASAAYTWNDIQFGGFASQGYLINTGPNDYLGETSEGTFDFREYAVNASWARGQWRLGGQLFGQKLGAYGDDKITLDWATLDFQPKQWLGLRAGRVKMPRGLYNEALDVDSVRPFVLLPQSVYDARLRDFNAAFNGGMIYGNVEIGRAGSLDYRLFYGGIPMDIDSGASDYFTNDVPLPNIEIGMDAVYGGTLFWNTPAPGLRVGYSYSAFENMSSVRDVYGVVYYRTAKTYHRHLVSAEYIWGDWNFATEVGRENGIYDLGLLGSDPVAFLDSVNEYYYASAARRVTAWLELGAYYSHSKEKLAASGIIGGMVFPALVQDDYAVSARFDLNEHLLFKLEAHYIDGSGKLFNTPSHPQPLEGRDNSWALLAAKVTFSF